MTLETIAQLASIVASLAVVISLIFIGLQLQQNAHLTRMAAAQTSAQMLSENFGRAIEFPDLAELLVSTDDYANWSPAQRLRMSNFLSVSFRHHEVLFTHRRYGIFEDELWEGANARLRSQLRDAAVCEWFEDSCEFYSKSFVAHVRKLAAQNRVEAQDA